MEFPPVLTESVVQLDIELGQPGTAGFCPMNLAVRRALLRMGCEWAVDPWRVEMWKQKLRLRPPGSDPVEYRLLSAAQYFAVNFDGGYEVEPFQFEAVRVTPPVGNHDA